MLMNDRAGIVSGSRSAANAAVLTATLGLAAASWVVAERQMSGQVNGMEVGAATPLGSFAFFVTLWVSMMAAMMLPGTAPAVVRRVRADDGPCAVVLAAGCYELTPLKRRFRQHCRESIRSGLGFGLCCVGSSIGLMLMLMLMLVALGVMSLAWISIIAAVVLAQKVLPAKAAIDVPLAVAILGLGNWIVLAPGSVGFAKVSCVGKERLVGSWHALAFRTKNPPALDNAGRVHTTTVVVGKKVVVSAAASDGLSIDAHAIVQAGAECAP